MQNFSLDNKADAALSKLQDTTLNPMEEALFQAWTKANKIAKPDAPEDRVDYRGVFKETQGKVLPNGQLRTYADKLNSEDKLRQILHEKMMQNIEKLKGNYATEQPKEEKNTPAEHHTYKLQNEGTELENEGTAKENEGLALQNEGKQLDIAKILASAKAAKEKPKTTPKKDNK